MLELPVLVNKQRVPIVSNTTPTDLIKEATSVCVIYSSNRSSKSENKTSESSSSTRVRSNTPRNLPALKLRTAVAAVILYLIQQQPIGSRAFNLDTNSAIVHSGPDDSYFGYTVAVHKDRNDIWLLVAAPKASTNQPNTDKAGAIYRCATKTNRACQQIDFDRNGSSMITLTNNTKVTVDNKSHQFFGASLHSSGDSGMIIACAPNYIYYSVNFKRRDPVGTCWISRGSFTGFLEYSPCRLNGK